MLDRLPAWARHLLIVAGSVFLAGVVSAVVDAGGVTGVDWPANLIADLNAAAVAVATASAALWLTPLTRQYGIGADSEDA